MQLEKITDAFLEEMGCDSLDSPRRAWIESLKTYVRGAQYALVDDGGRIWEIFEDMAEYRRWLRDLPNP